MLPAHYGDIVSKASQFYEGVHMEFSLVCWRLCPCVKPNIELNLNWKQMSLDLVSLNETQGVLAVPQPAMRSISNIRALVILLRLLLRPCHEVSKDTLSSLWSSTRRVGFSEMCVAIFGQKTPNIWAWVNWVLGHQRYIPKVELAQPSDLQSGGKTLAKNSRVFPSCSKSIYQIAVQQTTGKISRHKALWVVGYRYWDYQHSHWKQLKTVQGMHWWRRVASGTSETM